MNHIYIKVLLISLLGLWACHSTQRGAMTSNYSTSRLVSAECEENYEKGEEAKFVIKNQSKEKDVLLYHPKEILIEKYTGEKWERVDIMYCPCGASCPPPPEWGALKPEATKTIKWDLNEEWCNDKNSERKVPETNKKYAGSGTYRFVLRYSVDKGRQILTDYTRFKLK